MSNTLLQAWQGWNPLRRWRNQKGYTLRDAAVILGISVSTLQDWESGAVRPKGERMDQIFKVTSGLVGNDNWDRWMERKPEAA